MNKITVKTLTISTTAVGGVSLMLIVVESVLLHFNRVSLTYMTIRWEWLDSLLWFNTIFINLIASFLWLFIVWKKKRHIFLKVLFTTIVAIPLLMSLLGLMAWFSSGFDLTLKKIGPQTYLALSYPTSPQYDIYQYKSESDEELCLKKPWFIYDKWLCIDTRQFALDGYWKEFNKQGEIIRTGYSSLGRIFAATDTASFIISLRNGQYKIRVFETLDCNPNQKKNEFTSIIYASINDSSGSTQKALFAVETLSVGHNFVCEEVGNADSENTIFRISIGYPANDSQTDSIKSSAIFDLDGVKIPTYDDFPGEIKIKNLLFRVDTTPAFHRIYSSTTSGDADDQWAQNGRLSESSINLVGERWTIGRQDDDFLYLKNGLGDETPADYLRYNKISQSVSVDTPQ
jgi:hypothetical protein